LEQQIRQAHKIEAIGRLAAGIAHDFNNFLMIIDASAELLQAENGGTARGEPHLRQIRETVRKAAGMTKQLLTFSRKQVLQPGAVDLNPVVEEFWNMLPRLLGEEIETKLSLAPNLRTVSADRGQVEQVLMNLAVNARDAMPRGGRLDVETANFELTEEFADQYGTKVPPGNYGMLAVSDTGMGMDAETQSRIFEPFFTTKELGRGTGLGLSIVYGIVKQSGGFLSVSSEPGKGSTFRVFLPCKQVQPDNDEGARADSPAPGGSETVLLVEDEANLREIIAMFLRTKGYLVLEAANGRDAFRIANASRDSIRLIITDVVMPGCSGPETVKRVRELQPDVPAIYISGHMNEQLSAEILACNATLVAKPFSLESLAHAISAILRRNA
jgi:CheY-like chemotaxis protein